MPITEAELDDFELQNHDPVGLSRNTVDRLIAEVRELQAQLNSKPQRKSKKKQTEEALRESDLSAQLSGRDNIDYGHHETLPTR